ncbi:hypothetical protein CcaverHIS002_0608960 [Cutaneotrichosporon cavernicola]|uniref:Ceramide glucosyltransferase n=1 Tax=Cutaneotrichosporon cavernicola TaxID=279322 RepID=A0AA48QYI6_9TREE|nr:uncharacterized protein CcaverHIS019_0608420 [Cutaneotrichosporon cavernicola]BEI86609.1 hypothetical protein CcaverHIS002_0608960 [Cutaneotrichosporon cavernicola]BEI94383.1 hypothetical protein CcaverHIS019_0608420 [Cutaneotrichosporon cavernicola]BEJ02160.1 hypothetical protein CcaverHIS631_0608420 [Cutaneotrichosporon cavernicola]BEJ09921.1 hypothetical protein CcaverHIS641_0608360 [Cutaneotrichosporon cavernicola]
MPAPTYAAIGALVLYAVVWAVGLNGLRVARSRYGKRHTASRLSALPAASVPGVSVIRPLCGLDTNMYSTLESVMRLNYPNYEVIFALQNPKDEALPVVQKVMARHPHVPARVVINSAKVGVNPKVNNLMEPFAQASHDILWVLDATVAILPDALGHMVDAFLSRRGDEESASLIADNERASPSRGMVGLVHQVPTAVVYQPTWGSLIEQAYLNSTHAKMYLSINNVAIESCVVGKSCMYSRTNINALSSPAPSLASQNVKGMAGFGPFMAEDNMIALSLWHELGLKHAMTGDVATDFLGALTVRDYFMRRARWIRVRKMMTLPATSMEPLTESIVASLYGAWAVYSLFGVPKLLFWVLSMGAWLATDLAVRNALATNVRHVGPPQPTWRFMLAWAARECLALPIWLYAMLGSRVVWRGKAYRVLASGEAKRLD